MRPQAIALRTSLFLIGVLMVHPGFPAVAQTKANTTAAVQAAPVPARITQAIDETQRVTLKGNVHPLVRSAFDQGAVADSLPMNRILLVLRRSMEQGSALMQLMVDQQNTNSPNYHKWLTPEQFGAQFGPSDADIQTVTSWLQSHGFQVAKVSKGKLAIEFSGTAAQVKAAFHTEIHRFLLNGEIHLANASDPQIPLALAPVVHGLAPLNNFRPKPQHRVAGEFAKTMGSSQAEPVNPELTIPGPPPLYPLGPTDFATIYNVLPLWNLATPIDGTGQSIAVIGVSNINLQDVQDFRTEFGLPTAAAANTPIVVIDGADPGIINDGSETEALLDTEWSGAVAKGAQIHLVTAADTDIASGLLLAIFNVIDNNSDPVMSLSFGDCEANEGSNNLNLWEPLWEQAAAQGITVTVSTGDNGSAGCDNDMAAAPNPAQFGLAVSGFASTPFNVAVGGTDFNDAGTQSTYFNSTNAAGTLASAIGYIPESTWNDSCTNAAFGTNPETNCNSTAAANAAAVVTVGGSGGASNCATQNASNGCAAGYPKPAYQSFTGLTGMPADGTRDLPDVSLFASDGFNKSAYVVCEADAVSSPSCSGNTFNFLAVGGTSAPTPSFAGIMALVNQSEVAAGRSGRQGNANFVLYKLAQMQDSAATACNSVATPLPAAACTFNDITAGTIAMPCAKGSLNCNPTTGSDTVGVLSGFSATAGYDLATGLGSVNAQNLVDNWGKGVSAFTPTSVSLTLSPTTGITAGQSVNVSIKVTPSGATGDAALVSNAATGEGVDGFTLVSGGTVSSTTTQLTGGTYQVTARYGGDGTFAPSVSSPITVTVGKAGSTTTGSVLVSLGGGNFASFTSGTAPVTLFLQSSISPTVVANQSPLTPTGTVNFVDTVTVNGVTSAPATVASNVLINQAAEAFTASGISTFGPGSHSIVANYSGDPSFTPSSSPAAIFTITGGTASGNFTVAETAVTLSSATGAGVMSTVTVTSPSGGFAGPVAVMPSTSTPGVTCTPSPLNINATAASAVTGQLTCSVLATSSTLTAANAPQSLMLEAKTNTPPARGNGWWTLSAGTGFAALFLLFIPGGRKRYRAALGLGLVCVLSFTLGCGGGGSTTPPPTLTTTVTHLTANSGK
ncbi:MAG TPA: protease pro-enzyme activation domain-containing protein, partial [Candidatus Acidoferrum sp.]